MSCPKRRLPSVDRVLREPAMLALAEQAGRAVAVQAARRALARTRDELDTGQAPVHDSQAPAVIAQLALAGEAPRLRRVVNATGVILHTNLGRAPLATAALDAVAACAGGYVNLEYDLDRGERGSRQDAVEPLLCELTGAEAALVVTNNAAALVLCVAALAAGREVIVARGQLVEIGDGFRIPDILTAAGARLVEVATTNRAVIGDYEQAIGPDTAALLRVHPSNYRVVGFATEVGITSLAALGRRRGLIVIDDLGSGVLYGDPLLSGEPVARDSIKAGASIACFSGDKLLGGPQAGIIIGRRDVVDRVRRHPFARAMRISKLALVALEATLRLHRDPQMARRAIPVLAMMHEPVTAVSGRAQRLAAALDGHVVTTRAAVGGGSLPLLEVESAACALSDPRGALAARLRRGDPPVIGRLEDGELMLDTRTLGASDVDVVIDAVRAARRCTA